jgi:hypothetical protein
MVPLQLKGIIIGGRLSLDCAQSCGEKNAGSTFFFGGPPAEQGAKFKQRTYARRWKSAREYKVSELKCPGPAAVVLPQGMISIGGQRLRTA